MDGASYGRAVEDWGRMLFAGVFVVFVVGILIGWLFGLDSGPTTHEICQWRLDQVPTAADTLRVLDDHRECFNSLRLEAP